ncbi:MAG: hypothetical protein ACI8UQ_000276 [Bacteroidia bacterium]|jgi:hypothetical protein
MQQISQIVFFLEHILQKRQNDKYTHFYSLQHISLHFYTNNKTVFKT